MDFGQDMSSGQNRTGKLEAGKFGDSSDSSKATEVAAGLSNVSVGVIAWMGIVTLGLAVLVLVAWRQWRAATARRLAAAQHRVPLESDACSGMQTTNATIEEEGEGEVLSSRRDSDAGSESSSQQDDDNGSQRSTSPPLTPSSSSDVEVENDPVIADAAQPNASLAFSTSLSTSPSLVEPNVPLSSSSSLPYETVIADTPPASSEASSSSDEESRSSQQ